VNHQAGPGRARATTETMAVSRRTPS